MKKFVDFIKKPKNLYLSIAIMLVVVMGLTSISFSYYIEDSTNGTQVMKINKIDTFIQSDELTSDEVIVPANSSKIITINVVNNNLYSNEYALTHTNESVTVTSNKTVLSNINSKDVHTYELTFNNNTSVEQTTKLGIINAYDGQKLEVTGIQIK